MLAEFLVKCVCMGGRHRYITFFYKGLFDEPILSYIKYCRSVIITEYELHHDLSTRFILSSKKPIIYTRLQQEKKVHSRDVNIIVGKVHLSSRL